MSQHSIDLAPLLLKDELEFFLKHQDEWLSSHQGEFALIGRGTFCGFHASHQAALEAGIRAFGPVAPFLIKQVTQEKMHINFLY